MPQGVCVFSVLLVLVRDEPSHHHRFGVSPKHAKCQSELGSPLKMPFLLTFSCIHFSNFRKVYYIFVVFILLMASCCTCSAAVRAATGRHYSVGHRVSAFWRRSSSGASAAPAFFSDYSSRVDSFLWNKSSKCNLVVRRNLSLYVRGGGGAGRSAAAAAAAAKERPPSPLLNGQRICSFTTEAAEEDSLPRVLNRYPVTGCAAIGWRPYMEDEALIQSDLVAVFDGHGGSSVSRYVRQNLYGHIQTILPRVVEDRLKGGQVNGQEEDQTSQEISNNSDENTRASTASTITTTKTTPADYQKCLRLSLEKVNKEVMRIVHWSYQGSTAVVVWLHEELRRTPSTTNNNDDQNAAATDTEYEERLVRTLVAANIGDSRLIISRNGQAVALSRDHKPDDPVEMEYIRSVGGRVTYPSGVPRVNGVMALSRAIGDRSETPCIRAEPDLILEELLWTDDFYVLATDGLWDVMTNQDVVTFLYPCLEGSPSDDVRQEMTKELVLEALSRGAEDNITVVVVWLR